MRMRRTSNWDIPTLSALPPNHTDTESGRQSGAAQLHKYWHSTRMRPGFHMLLRCACRTEGPRGCRTLRTRTWMAHCRRCGKSQTIATVDMPVKAAQRRRKSQEPEWWDRSTVSTGASESPGKQLEECEFVLALAKRSRKDYLGPVGPQRANAASPSSDLVPFAVGSQPDDGGGGATRQQKRSHRSQGSISGYPVSINALVSGGCWLAAARL